MIDWQAKDIKDPAQQFFSHRHFKWLTGINYRGAARQALGWRECYAAYGFGTEVYQYLYQHPVFCLEEIVYFRQATLESGIYYTASD
jgi:hypothetical protein